MSARRKRAGYVEAAQFEMPIDGGFRLITESAVDGDRITREAAESEAARERSAACQLSIFDLLDGAPRVS